MKTRISALMDGELESHEIDSTFEALKNDPRLQSQWSEFHWVGAVLRGEIDNHTDLTARVLAAVENEPTVLVPRIPSRSASWRQPLMALAASLAGVAVVGWVGLGDSGTTLLPQVVLVSRSNSLNAVPAAIKEATMTGAESSHLQAYVVAHQAHGSAHVFGGGTHYVRTVAIGSKER